jgi:hypothetical protein
VSRRRAIALLAAVFLSSCARPDPTGLHVKGYAADLVFGAHPPLVPRGAGPGPTVAPSTDLQLPDVIAPRTGLRPPVRKTCPDAALGAGALDQASPIVPSGRRPEVGRSRWKRKGTQTVTTGVTAGAKIDIGGFAYQTLNTDFIGGTTYVTTWQVKPEALQERETALTASVAVGDPERGLTIKAIDNFDNTGQMTGSFRPRTGLLVLPLPVVPGEQFVSVAIDPQTFQVAQYQAQVVSRDRIDACGDFVEGWLVKGTLTFSGGQPQQYDILVAPQFGALVVSEHVVGQNIVGPFDVTFSLGQLHPAPL